MAVRHTLLGAGTLAVVERFVSINGEGRNAGKLAAFVRFRQCNLDCSYCDTRWANQEDCPAEELTVAQIVEWVRSCKVAYVTLTGGEPLLQPLLPDLIEALLSDQELQALGLVVEIETNGSRGLQQVATLRQCLPQPQRLQITMDWKLPSSGMAGQMLEENLAYLTHQDVLKMVAGSEEDLLNASELIRAKELETLCHVYVSPVFGCMDPARLAEFVKEEGYTQVTVQLQLHKVLWPQIERGV